MNISKKNLSWRILSTLNVFLLSWILTGNVLLSLSLGVIEFIIRTILTRLHDKVWEKYGGSDKDVKIEQPIHKNVGTDEVKPKRLVYGKRAE